MIFRNISVSSKGGSVPINIVQGTDMMDFNFFILDFEIPSGSTVVAYNVRPDQTTTTQTCNISDNTIKFTPRKDFFGEGKNKTQFRITNNNKNLFSFILLVLCDKNITSEDALEINNNPTLLSQVLSAIGILSARVDTFTSLPEGSTTGNAELADIRVGTDGKTYDTAGNAVRTQISNLNGDLVTVQKKIGVGLDVYGLSESDYEAVDITDLFTPGNYNSWVQSSNNGSGTVLSPIFKTPQKLVIINNNTTVLSNRASRFLNGESADSVVATSDTESYRSDRWSSDVPVSGTKTIYTYEFGRSGREYMQIRWTNGSFNSWKGKFRVIAYYTDKRPQYDEISDSDGFEHDVDIKWGATVCGSVSLTSAVLLAIVPFIPGIKYTVKGGNWTTSISTNISNAYALYDDSLLNNYYPALGSPSGTIIPVQPPYRTILSDIVVVESGATNGGKGVVTYTCPDPSETKDYPKWIAFAMSNATKPTIEDTSIIYSYDTEMIRSWIDDRINGLDTGRAGWGYVTRFDTLIDRPAKTKDFVNPYKCLDDSSSRYSALQAGSSPLCGAKWVIFGDSINDNFGGDTREGNGFISKISREFGLIPDNRAKSGSNINDGDESYSNLSGINMLDAFLQEIEDGTTEQPEYIIIAYGHNSYGSHVGSVDDTSAEHKNSICGAMKYFIEKIREKCPNTVFGFVLPYQSDWSKSTAPNEYKDIAAGRQAMLSVLQLEGYQVPYIDMWTQSGITVDMLPDAIHPGSDQAKTLYYHALRRFIMGL